VGFGEHFQEVVLEQPGLALIMDLLELHRAKIMKAKTGCMTTVSFTGFLNQNCDFENHLKTFDLDVDHFPLSFAARR
jgi:hypothetical protein